MSEMFEPKENGIECDCPFCPLKKANTQVCDFIVHFDTKNERIGSLYNGKITDEEKKALTTLAIIGRNNWKLKIGSSDTVKMPNYTFSVARTRRDIYKVCFHNNRKADGVK